MFFLLILFNLEQGTPLVAYFAIAGAVVTTFLVKYQRDKARQEIKNLKEQNHWQMRLLTYVNEANPEALRAGISVEADELLKLYKSEEIQLHYADPESEVTEKSLDMLNTQIKQQKANLSRLVETAVAAGHIMQPGWRYQDLASKRNC